MGSMDYTDRIIDRRYRIKRILGEGGMGTVYLGEHLRMGKKVAVKFLHTEFSDDDLTIKRFFREAEIIATLRHANIIDVLDVGVSDENEPYMVLEYLEGEDLATLIKRSGPLDLSAAIGVVTPVLNALATAHESGIIHRDLKPDNIFLVQPLKGEPIVKLIDFGISKLMNINTLSTLTKEGAFLGTPMYMSPEQIQAAEHVDHRSDLYSVGVIFYMILTGKLPFDANNYPSLFMKILSETPIPPKDASPDFPTEVECIVMKLLRKEPKQRYQTADEVLADLKKLRQYTYRQESLSKYTMGVSDRRIAWGDLGPRLGNPLNNAVLHQMAEGQVDGARWRGEGVGALDVAALADRSLEQASEDFYPFAKETKNLRPGLRRSLSDETAMRTTGSLGDHGEAEWEFPSILETKELASLLLRVREFWVDGLLQQNKNPLSTMPQPKTLSYSLVDVPWKPTGRGTPNTESLSPTLPLTKIYHRLKHRMLILGDSGHGKTLSLIEILKNVCDDAQHSDVFTHPIPVLFTLSSWHPGKGTLFDWMVDELAIKYVIPRKYGRRWLEQRFIVPFLDGLNEVQPEYMAACIEVINDFSSQYTPRGLVVSCRKQEYVAAGVKLNLNGSVTLESLEKETIVDFMNADRWKHLRAAIEDAPELEAMLQVPLILQIACEVVDDNSEFFKSEELRTGISDTIFKRYVDITLHTSEQDQHHRTVNQRTGTVLHQLASGMMKTGDTVFLFETLQPKWLRRKATSIIYAILSRLIIALLFGLSTILPMGLSPLENAGFETSLRFAGQLGIISALILGLGYGIKTIFDMRFGRRTSRRPGIRSILLTLLFNLILGATAGGMLYGVYRHPVVVVMGIQLAVFGGILLGFYRRGRSVLDRDIVPVEAVSWNPAGLKSWRFLWVIALGVVTAVASAHFEDNLKSGLHVLATVFLIGFALLGYVKGHTFGRPVPNVGIRQSLKNALLMGGVSFVITTFSFGYTYGILYGACVAGTVATFIALWFGGIEVINHLILRMLLALEGTLGFFVRKVLSNAVKDSMLRQVGGGFMFEHETLIKHFAGVPNVIVE